MSSPILQIMVGGKIPLDIGEVAEVELLEQLGVGGFGSVWKVVDTNSKNIYTLKIIQGLLPGSITSERVRLEATLFIPSEYIIPVLGIKEWNSSAFLILFEYCQGTSLDKLIAAKSLSSSQKKEIFRQILLGVSDAHLCNVIHRDVKPENILVTDTGKVKIIDFGISKFKGAGLTKTGDFMGTIQYVAPEMLMDGSKMADSRTDIYALGHVLYELSMGEHFWTIQGWSELKDFISYIKKTPTPTEAIDLTGFSCDFYPQAVSVIPKMVKFDIEERYTYIDEIISDLGDIPYLPPELPADFSLRYPMLIIESGSNQGSKTVINIEEGENRTFGRAEIAGGNDSISRQHLQFSRHETDYYVKDIHSKNGTLVRGKALSPEDYPTKIQHGDRLKVGDVFLRFAFLKTK
jgi:serine/threonine-protein kinase